MEGQELARHPATEALIRTRHAGIAKVGKKEITVKTVDEESREYLIPHGARIRPEELTVSATSFEVKARPS